MDYKTIENERRTQIKNTPIKNNLSHQNHKYRWFIGLNENMIEFEKLCINKKLSREDLALILNSIKLNSYTYQL